MIDQLIDRDYFTVHISAALAQVTTNLQERPCFAVLNDRLDVLGIITLTDLRDQSYRSLDQINFAKPVLSPRTSLRKAVRLMRSSGNSLLPVYLGKQFIGTLSLIDLAEYLLRELSQIPARRKSIRPNR